jgi:hypothetical protein
VPTKLINQDNVTNGLRTVTQVLNPFVQQHMSRTYGKNWLQGFVQRHPRSGSSEEHLGDLGYLIWVLTKEESAFKSALTPRARSLAHRVREARNLSSHDQLNDIDQETARAALQSMAEFLRLIGASGQAGEVMQLAGQVKPAAGAELADAVAEVDPVGSPGALREGEIAIQSWCRQLKSLSPYCSRSGVGRVWPASWQRSRYSA